MEQRKECILRTDPETNFTSKEVQDVLKVMKAKWKVGVTDNHVEQSHIERCFRELNSHLRPLLVDLYKKDPSPMNIRMGAYLSMRIYNNSVNSMGFAPAQIFTPSETLDLQILEENLDENGKSNLVRNILDLQQKVLSDMLIKQQELYDNRLSDWTKDCKAAWDQLLALDIDDYVMINYPKNQKLNFSNIGPFKVVEMVDKDFFLVVQSLTDIDVKIKIKANKVLRFNYNRVGKRPITIAAEDRRDTQVIKMLGREFTGEGEFKASKGQRQLLRFHVLF